MVLDDCPAVDLDEERFRAAVAPKLMGAWNLHLLTRRDDLDLFVLFSSVVTTLGNPTQANYSAGNVFLEMLALQRRARGLPGLAIQWGVLGGGGVVARDRELGERLERRGFLPLERRDALDALGHLLDRDPGVAIAARMDWSRWARFAPGALGSPRLSEVLAEGVPSDSHPSAASTVIASVAAAAPADRRPALEGHVVRLLATVLGTSADRVDPTLPMNEVGLDSLIAVELTTTLRASLGVEVPVVRLLDGVSPRELAERLLPEVSERLGPGPEPPPPPKEPVPSGPARPVRWSRTARVLRPLVWLSFRAVARLEIEGPGSCPPDGPLIVATNHVSFLDAPLVLTVVPRPTVVLVTDVMRRVPVVATFLRAFGSIFVRRGEGDVDALAKALEVLSAGGAVAIAPEGRRSSHGLIQGQSGVSHLAMASCSPVLPLAAFGQERLSRRWWMLRRSRVTVRLGPLVEPPPPGATALQLAAHTERVMTSLAALLPGPYQGRYREFVED
jgi:1-acyl-sn-glycerol-3-phosphate acyltransferase